jgi:hypothetical protein
MNTVYKFLMSAFLLSPFAANALETTPGNLATLLGDDANTLTTLTLTGSANAIDLVTIKDMPMLKELDMKDLAVEAYSSRDEIFLGRKSFLANELPAYIFATTNIESVVLPEGLTTIGEGVFAGSSLKSIAFGSALTEIDDYAFYDTALTTVTLPASVAVMGKGAFASCSQLTNVDMSATALVSLPEQAFKGDALLAAVAYPSGLTNIGAESFMATAIEELVVPSSVTSVDDYAFSQMPKLQTATLPNLSNTTGMLFNNPTLTSLGGDLANIGNLGVASCANLNLNYDVDNDVNIELNSKIVTLGDYAYADNASAVLEFEQLKSVGSHVFDNMTALNTIGVYHLGGNVAATVEDSFEGITPSTINLYVDDADSEVWEADEQWSKFHIVATETTVKPVLEDQEVNILCSVDDNNNILVTASDILTGVVVSDASGMLVATVAPKAERATIDLSVTDAKVLVVKASTAEATKTFKLQRR